ncbi:MAG TPA: hypothetical protein VN668_01755 [Stellaceae bacterium]|nr:hypothetical protein [Stellaceae bacterium]
MYTIEYEHQGAAAMVPMRFVEKQLAIANACELLKLGFHVSKVEGPGFQMGPQALAAYRRALIERGGAVKPKLGANA